jgi:hypothetical protein
VRYGQPSIYQRIRENRKIDIDETASEMSISHEKGCRSGVRPNREHFIVMESGCMESTMIT